MPSGKTRSTTTKATDDMADLKESIELISAKLDELLPIRKEISCVLKAVEKLERDSAEKDKKIKAIESRLDNIDQHNRLIGELFQKVATLEAEGDKREQYSRRPNLRFHGIEEKEGEDTKCYCDCCGSKETRAESNRSRPAGAQPQNRAEARWKGRSAQARGHCSLSKRSHPRRSVSCTRQLERTQ